MTMLAVAELQTLLRDEIRQRAEEGVSVDGWKARARQAGKRLDDLHAVYDALMALRPPPEREKAEPSDLPGIRRCRPRTRPKLAAPRSPRHLRDRLAGAVLGRCAGCMLGKPVEGLPRSRVWTGLRRHGEFPLRDYFARSTIRAIRDDPIPDSWTRGRIRCAVRDDDTDYTILGLHCLRTHGPTLSTRQIADEWLQCLPYGVVCTAERAAYRNLVAGLPLSQVPLYRNPYREWIGAQIRADGWAYCAAGLPTRAAEFAFRDASLSHVKNGIFGEMFFAAIIAAAPCCEDVQEAIEIGLAEIPAESRLARAVREVLGWAEHNRDWRETREAIEAEFGRYHWVHTINNAAVVIMALCHGGMDFGRTICIAVMGGWDTDCNGATAGSVLGGLIGASRLPAKWTRPLRNRLRSAIMGYDNTPITGVADMAMEVNRRLCR